MSKIPLGIKVIAGINILEGIAYLRGTLYFFPWVITHLSRIIKNTPTERGMQFEYLALFTTFLPIIGLFLIAAFFSWAAISVFKLKRRILNICVAIFGFLMTAKYLPYTFAANLKGETEWGIFLVRVIIPFLVIYFIWTIFYLTRPKVKEQFK